jgi:hypothetical protein
MAGIEMVILVSCLISVALMPTPRQRNIVKPLLVLLLIGDKFDNRIEFCSFRGKTICAC